MFFLTAMGTRLISFPNGKLRKENIILRERNAFYRFVRISGFSHSTSKILLGAIS